MNSIHISAELLLQAAIIRHLHGAIPPVSSLWGAPIGFGVALIAASFGVAITRRNGTTSILPRNFCGRFILAAVIAVPIVTVILPSPAAVRQAKAQYVAACNDVEQPFFKATVTDFDPALAPGWIDEPFASKKINAAYNFIGIHCEQVWDGSSDLLPTR